MKRTDAERKIATIIKRLDARVTEPEVIINRVLLFGSMLTSKKSPGDIDIALSTEIGPALHSSNIGCLPFYEYSRRHDSAVVRIRKGMKKISIHWASEVELCHYPHRQIWPPPILVMLP